MPSQKIDTQARGDGERHDSDLSKDGNVKRYIGYRHEYGSRHSSARAQFLDSDFMFDRRSHPANCLDSALGLRKVFG